MAKSRASVQIYSPSKSTPSVMISEFQYLPTTISKFTKLPEGNSSIVTLIGNSETLEWVS